MKNKSIYHFFVTINIIIFIARARNGKTNSIYLKKNQIFKDFLLNYPGLKISYELNKNDKKQKN
jgi:hypothetical protein